MFVMSHLEKQQSAAAAAAAAAASTAVAGKTARPCDGCARWRARWYCAADDAFLCQSCDSSVHSTNPVARRHHRLRIKSSSSSGGPDVDDDGPGVPSWLRGCKRKARTPRPHQHLKTVSAAKKARPTKVPELVEASVDETEDDEQQLLYCVPVFDPALVEFRSPPSLHDSNATCSGDEAKLRMELSESTPESTSTIDTANRLASLLPSDMELAEFAINMESLLGSGLDGSDDSFSMEKLGLVHSMEDNDNNVSYCLDNADGRLKTEQLEDAEHCCPIDLDLDLTRERLELDFNFPGSSTAEEDDLDEEKIELTRDQQEEATKQAKLRLNYEAVIAAWSSHGSSPWTGGERPQINLDNFTWTDYMVMWAEGVGEGGAVLGARHGGNTGGGHADVGRRARVTRYREKRRTRLFAKKIRYEVRKLNAEKRPRMKGRFVKRAPGLLH